MLQKLRLGIIGGGPDSFIGNIHYRAAMLDGEYELVCGAFSSNPSLSRKAGETYRLPSSRVYDTWQDMISKELALPEDERMEIVAITTPNHLHYPQAMAALSSGFHVICDKPVTISLEQALQLETKVKKTGLAFALTHNYTGYPMVKEARSIVRKGSLGKIRKIVVEYPQGWLSSPIEKSNSKQAQWRTNPELNGPGGCLGDIGTHAANLVDYITDLELDEICADKTSFVSGRLLDDDVTVLLKFKGGAKGILYASQISAGEENNLSIRIYGEMGGLEWNHNDANTLVIKTHEQPLRILRAGTNYMGLSDETRWNLRLPGGHPEGFIESFANIYRNFANYLQRSRNQEQAYSGYTDFPTIKDGVKGMYFIEKVLEASVSSEKWTKYTT